MQARALVALLALALAITLGVSRPHHGAGDPDVAAAVGRVAGDTPEEPAAPAPAKDDEATAASRGRGTHGPSTRRTVDCKRKRCVALTFDDGPGLDTPRLLQVLARRKAPATFFLVGQMLDGRRRTARQIARAGHEIGVHTWAHPNLTTLPDKWVTWQLAHTKRLITEVTGVRPVLSRPPYGASNPRVLRLQGELGLSEVLWDVDTSDWKIRNSGYVSRTAVQRARRNSVILMHDIRPTTVAAVDSMIRGLRRRGFTLVTVSEVIGKPVAGRTYFDWRTPTHQPARRSTGGKKRPGRRSAH